VVAIFFEKLLTGQRAVIYGDGGQTRDFTFVGDVVMANLAAIDYGKVGAFNVGTGIETDINTLFDMIRDIGGSNQERIHEPGKAGEQRRSVIDNNAIKQAMGWLPRHDLREGLAKTAEYFRLQIKK
jgi:UDP-glucose 4-epimerase